MNVDDDSVTSWTTRTTSTKTTPLHTRLNTSPGFWSAGNSASTQYELEPVSPSSSPGSAAAVIPVFYAQRPSAPVVVPQSPQCSPDAPVVIPSAEAQPTSSSVHSRCWNGDDGHPYSPLKRVLHQYQAQENGRITPPVSSDNACTNGTTNGVLTPSPPSSATSVPVPPAASAVRKPTTTTAGISFEEFVLGMLSKVGGGKAITAATQSYLRDSAASSTSNRGVSGTASVPAEPRTTISGDVIVQPHSESTHRPK